MRAAVLLALGLALATPVMAGALPLEFSAPANYDAERSSLEGASWALLVFDAPGSDITVGTVPGSMVENTTWIHPIRLQSADSEYDPVGHPETSHAPLDTDRLSLSPRPRSSIFIVADEIRLVTGAGRGTIETTGVRQTLAEFSRPQDDREHIHRHHDLAADEVVITYTAEDASDAFQLSTMGPRRVEWFGVDTDCGPRASACADAGGANVQRLPGFLGYNATSEAYTYQTLDVTETLHGGGHFGYAVLGGTRLTVELTGGIRLPIARTADDCDCQGPDNQTASFEGSMRLEQLQVVGPGRVSTGVDGHLDTARFDESPIDPEVIGLGAVALTVAVAGWAIAKGLLAILFTKLRESEVLLMPRRRAIYDAIVASPGIGFRELSRATGILPNAVRHHLGVLLRHNKVVEKSHGYSLRYFENHGKFDRTWRSTAVLRDANLAALNEWIAARGTVNQKSILDEWEGRGWGRSSTQHRLGRLESNGMLVSRRQGRLKVYTVAPQGGQATPNNGLGEDQAWGSNETLLHRLRQAIR